MDVIEKKKSGNYVFFPLRFSKLKQTLSYLRAAVLSQIL